MSGSDPKINLNRSNIFPPASGFVVLPKNIALYISFATTESIFFKRGITIKPLRSTQKPGYRS